MKNNLMLALLTVIVLASGASAAVKQYDKEFSIFGNYIGLDAENNGSEDTLGGGVSVGYFLTDEFQMGIQGLGAWSDDVDFYAAGLNLKYHFTPADKNTLYAGGQLNYAYADNHDSDNGVMWGPLVGIKIGEDEKTSVFIEYQYQLFNGGIGDSIDDAHAILVGISFKY